MARPHVGDLAAELQGDVLRELNGGQDLFNVLRDVAQVVADRCDQHVDQARQIVVVHGIRAGLERQGSHIPEEYRWPPPLVSGRVSSHRTLPSGARRGVCSAAPWSSRSHRLWSARGRTTRGCAGADDRDVEEVLGCGQALFRILRQKEIAVTAFSDSANSWGSTQCLNRRPR